VIKQSAQVGCNDTGMCLNYTTFCTNGELSVSTLFVLPVCIFG